MKVLNKTHKVKRYFKKDKFSNLSEKEVQFLSEFVYNYCVKNFGYNNRKKTQLTYELQYKDSKYYGWYCSLRNKIIIHTKICKTIGEFVNTFIHEYTHSTQPCLTKYDKLLEKYGYANHPFEIEAANNETIHGDICLREFRKTLVKTKF